MELGRNEAEDLIYFVEDDYIHLNNSISEMLFSYEKFSTILKSDIFLIPADYPYLYTKNIDTKIFFGHQVHWRSINESLVTFLTSKEIIVKNFEKLIVM